MRSHTCQIVGSEKREQSHFFMLNALLQSRIDTGHETTDDEDVNVYVAGLLHRVLLSGRTTVPVSEFQTDLAGSLEANDLRTRYRVYRANADHALIATSLFDRPSLRRRTARDRRDTSSAAARGSVYYGFAANLSERINRRRPAVAVVLRKLSERFDTYAEILTHVRIEHLKLTSRISDAEIERMQRSAHFNALPFIASAGRDHFLDAYSEWMKTRSEHARAEVNAMGTALSEIDPDFRFEPV